MPVEENQPLSSDDEKNIKPSTLERVLEECGSFSFFQYMHTFFLLLFPVACGIFNFYFVFATGEPSYTCQLPEENEVDTTLYVLPSQCEYEKRNDQNESLGVFACSSWTYGSHPFGNTFTKEANLICGNSIQRSFLATALQMGAMFIFFTGQIIDLIGRRRSMFLLVGLLLGTSFIVQILIQFGPLSIKQKFVLLIINQFVAGIDTYMASFLLMMELTTSSYATLVGNLALLGYAAGEIVITGMAYLCKDWLLLKWVMTLYVLALVPYLYFLPESPRWLLIKSRYDELEKLLSRIARSNGRPKSSWMPYYRYVVEQHRQSKDKNRKNKIQLSFFAKIRRFLTHVPTMSRLLISGFLGFTTLLLFFKIAFSLGSTTEINPYINLIIGALVEAAGYLAASVMMFRIDRKPVLIVFLILTAACLIFTPYISEEDHWKNVFVAQLGKFAISGAVGVTYIFVPELFPTSIRATGMGFFVLFSRLGSTFAPMIDASISHNHTLVTRMYYLYAIFTLFCIFLTLFLPETRNVPLADKIDYNRQRKKTAVLSSSTS